MSNYATGTVTVTNNSLSVVGVGTNWLSAMIEAGDLFNVIDGKAYEIASVIDDTHLSLVTPYQGDTAAAQNYVVGRSLEKQGIAALAARVAALEVGIQPSLTVIPEGLSLQLRDNEQAIVFDSLTVNGDYTVDGELRVQAWPA